MISERIAKLVSDGLIHPSWAPVLDPVEPQLAALGEFLRAESESGAGYQPAGKNILRAFSYPFDGVKVLIVGQDPYPTPGHPIGLSFAAEPHVLPVPRSLGNIFRELVDDTGIAPPVNGDLTPWSEQGIMLLNRVLTVRPGAAGSHRGKGWEAITDHAVTALASRGTPLVSILWGRDAQALAPLLQGTAVIQSVHPSPLSASRGFFGSKPFSAANELLASQGGVPVDWSLPAPALRQPVGTL